jgi:hypothetical protein
MSNGCLAGSSGVRLGWSSAWNAAWRAPRSTARRAALAWLKNIDLDTVPITRPARKQDLTDLLSRLEWDGDAEIAGCDAEQIAAAQRRVAADMSW